MSKKIQPAYEKQMFYPHKALRGFIDWYCVLTPSMQDLTSVPWHIMPDGAAHILLHVYSTGGGANLSNRLVFVGPRSTYVFTNRKQRILSLVARLKPGVSFLSLPYPLYTLKDTSIELEEVCSMDLSQAREELTELAGTLRVPALVARFDQFMLDVHRKHISKNALVLAAIQLIETNKGRLSMREVSGALGVSGRHLRSVFNRDVGLSPKLYSRIVRITNTIGRVDGGYELGHAQLALSSGYYDQSHMIEEFQALVGESTDAFISRTNREDVLLLASVFSNTRI